MSKVLLGLPPGSEEPPRIIDRDVTKEMQLAVGTVADKHGIPFHMLGPMLVAIGNQFRHMHAGNMVKRYGATAEQATAYLENTRCEIIDFSDVKT